MPTSSNIRVCCGIEFVHSAADQSSTSEGVRLRPQALPQLTRSRRSTGSEWLDMRAWRTRAGYERGRTAGARVLRVIAPRGQRGPGAQKPRMDRPVYCSDASAPGEASDPPPLRTPRARSTTGAFISPGVGLGMGRSTRGGRAAGRDGGGATASREPFTACLRSINVLFARAEGRTGPVRTRVSARSFRVSLSPAVTVYGPFANEECRRPRHDGRGPGRPRAGCPIVVQGVFGASTRGKSADSTPRGVRLMPWLAP